MMFSFNETFFKICVFSPRAGPQPALSGPQPAQNEFSPRGSNPRVSYFRNGAEAEKGWKGPFWGIAIANDVLMNRHCQKGIQNENNVRKFEKMAMRQLDGEQIMRNYTKK